MAVAGRKRANGEGKPEIKKASRKTAPAQAEMERRNCGLKQTEKASRKTAPVLTESESTIRGLKQTKKYRAIRKDLLDQLERNCTTGCYYTDLVEDYMEMWITKELAIADIHRRGLVVTYDNGGGQSGKKKNDSVDSQIKLNAQMLKILAEMGIKPSQGDGDGDEL